MSGTAWLRAADDPGTGGPSTVRAAGGPLSPSAATRLGRLNAAAAAAFALLAAFPAYLPGLPLRLNHVAALLVVGTFVMTVLGLRKADRFSSPPQAVAKTAVVYGCALVAMSALLSAPGAVTPLDAYSYALRFVLGVAILLALPAFALDPSRRARRLARAFILGGTVASVLAIVGYFVPAIGAETIGVGRRAESLFDHPNQYGMVVLALFPLAFTHALEAPRRPWRWVSTGLLATGVLLSGSFANTLLLVAGAALLLLSVFTHLLTLKRVVLALTVALLVVGAALALGPQALVSASPRVADMLSSFQATGDLSERLPSVDERLSLYRSALETWLEHPVVGVGADNAGHYLRRPSGAASSHAHNMFINTALTTGLVGLAALCVLVIGWLSLAGALLQGRAARAGDALLAKGVGTGLLLLFLSNQSSDSLSGTVTYPLWVLLGIGFALCSTRPPVRREP